MGWLQDRFDDVSDSIGTGGANTNIWDQAGNALNTSVGGDSSLGKAFTQVAQGAEKTVKDLPKIAEAVTKNTLAQAKAFVKNPIPTLATMALTAVGVPYPYASAIVDVANGGSWEKAVIQMGMNYYAGTGDATVPKSTLEKVLTSASTSAVSAKLLGATDQEVINAALGGAVNTYVSDLLYKPVEKGGYGLNPNDVSSKLMINTTSAVTNAVLRGKPIGDAIVQSAMITASSHYVKQGLEKVTKSSETLQTAQKYLDEAKAKVKSLWTPSMQAKKDRLEKAEAVAIRTHEPEEKKKAQEELRLAKGDYEGIWDDPSGRESFAYQRAARDYDRAYEGADRAERDNSYHEQVFLRETQALDSAILSSTRDDDKYGFTADEVAQITSDEINKTEIDAIDNRLAVKYNQGPYGATTKPPSQFETPEQLQEKLEQEIRDKRHEDQIAKIYADSEAYDKANPGWREKNAQAEADRQASYRAKLEAEQAAQVKAAQAYTQPATTTPAVTPPTTPSVEPTKTPYQLAMEAEEKRVADYKAKVKADADTAAQAKAAEEKRIADEKAAVEASKQKEYADWKAADEKAKADYVKEKAERQAKEEAAANTLAEANRKAKEEADVKAAQDRQVAEVKAVEEAKVKEAEKIQLATKAVEDKAAFDAHLKTQDQTAKLAQEAEEKARRQQELDNAEGARLAAERQAKAKADAEAKAKADADALAEHNAQVKAAEALPTTPKTVPEVPPKQTEIGSTITNAGTAAAVAAIAKQIADEKAAKAKEEALATQAAARAKAKVEYDEKVKLQKEAQAKQKAEYDAKVKAAAEAKAEASAKALAAYNEKVRLQKEAQAKGIATGTGVTPTGTLKPVGTTTPTPTGTLKPVGTGTAPTGTLKPVSTGTTTPAPTGTLTPVTKPAAPTGGLTPVTKPTGTLTPVTKPAAPTGGLTPVAKPITPVAPTGGLTAVKPTTPVNNLPPKPTSTTITPPAPTGTLKPVTTQPTGALKPVAAQPTGALKPVAQPTGALKPVTQPTGTLKPV